MAIGRSRLANGLPMRVGSEVFATITGLIAWFVEKRMGIDWTVFWQPMVMSLGDRGSCHRRRGAASDTRRLQIGGGKTIAADRSLSTFRTRAQVEEPKSIYVVTSSLWSKAIPITTRWCRSSRQP